MKSEFAGYLWNYVINIIIIKTNVLSIWKFCLLVCVPFATFSNDANVVFAFIVGVAAAVAVDCLCPVLCDSMGSIAWMTQIEASRTIMLAVNRFDVRYHIIYVAFV